MPFLFQTNRLRCRRWIGSDFDAVYAIYSDPVAMRWVGEGKPITREACEKWFEITETNYRTRGYGMYAVEDKTSGLVIGCCGLTHPGGQSEVEIKYTFLQAHWGKGLASEIVPQLLRYGWEVHGLARVIATVDPENIVSQKTLTKAGARLAERRLEGSKKTEPLLSSMSGLRKARPNPSLNPRPATAGAVSPVRASRTIVAYRAYSTCLRGRG